MISFILPTYNEEKVIAKTLQQLKNLDFIPFEIIVSDNKSSDQTAKIARKYADQVLLNESSGRFTIGQTRNHGAAAAKYEFLVFLDSDVEIPAVNNFFKIALEKFHYNPKLVALAPKIRVRKNDETFGDKFFFNLLNIWLRINNYFGFGGAAGELQMIKASSFKQAGGYQNDLIAGEDMELFSRLSKIGKTMIDKNLTVYHSGRRAHKIGWLRLFLQWNINWLWLILFSKAKSKEWKAIR